MSSEPDAYGVLQVLPSAEPTVLQAAFRALARRYHPDGEAPDPGRMAQVNRAYALVRTAEARAIYDLRRIRGVPIGPGRSAPPPPPDASEGTGGFFARAARRSGREPAGSSVQLDFGRYMGWSLARVADHDPDYLRWLSRHSSGLRYRSEIQRVLGNVDVGLRSKATA